VKYLKYFVPNKKEHQLKLNVKVFLNIDDLWDYQ